MLSILFLLILSWLAVKSGLYILATALGIAVILSCVNVGIHIIQSRYFEPVPLWMSMAFKISEYAAKAGLCNVSEFIDQIIINRYWGIEKKTSTTPR